MPDTTLLASCPFCGDDCKPMRTSPQVEVWSVVCAMCNAQGPFDTDCNAACQAWNSRPNSKPAAALSDAATLLAEIMRGEVNAEDEAEKWLRAYAPEHLFPKAKEVEKRCPECCGLGGRFLGDPCHGTESWEPCSCAV